MLIHGCLFILFTLSQQNKDAIVIENVSTVGKLKAKSHDNRIVEIGN